MKLRVAGIVEESIVDGPGLRLVVFAQGCDHRCRGCQNPATFDKTGGKLVSIDEIVDLVKSNPLLDGVTFSGGEPLLQAAVFSVLAKRIHELGLNVFSYTGFVFEDLLPDGKDSSPEIVEFLGNIDTLVDGPFILEKKSLSLRFKGSSNQRIIDVRRSFAEGRTVVIG